MLSTTLLPLLFLAASALPYPQPVRPHYLRTNSSATAVPFDACPTPDGGSPPYGLVHAVTISPCTRDEEDEPCRFEFSKNYTISVDYTSFLAAESPRTTLMARDDTVLPTERYPYSGQTFDGCAYTDCPVAPGVQLKYIYNFETLLSPFNYLTINMTETIDGPAILCAGFDAQYVGGQAAEEYKQMLADQGDMTEASSR